MKSHISRWISKNGSFIISIMSKHNSVFAGLVKFRKLLAIKGIIFLDTACCPNFYIRNLVLHQYTVWHRHFCEANCCSLTHLLIKCCINILSCENCSNGTSMKSIIDSTTMWEESCRNCKKYYCKYS